MNNKIIGALVVGIVFFVAASLYFSSATMPFGIGTSDMEEHMDDHRHDHDEHDDDEHEYDDDAVEYYEIYPGDAVKRMQSGEGVIILDVRTPEEYEEIHLENALLLPVEEMTAQTLNQIGLGENAKDKEIIIYCRSGARSQVAYNIMKSLGYTNIKSVAGGMIHWEEDNYPLTETGVYTGPSATNNTVNEESIKSGAKISIDRILHDFGEIAQYGGVVETDFIVTNKGTGILVIGDITTSCSCASATISDTSIEPGDSATLTVVFDPDFHDEPLGIFKRTVFIPTNDPDTPEAEVSVQMNILEGV